MTSATYELRRMLDERGVEWMDDSYAQLWCTVWHGQDGKQWRMTENQSGMLTELKAWKATPAQAIDATLGRGTCELDFIAFTKDGVDFAGFRCDECGFTQAVPGGSLWGVTRDWSYCPNCGRKVVM